jgi:hypothetical protein
MIEMVVTEKPILYEALEKYDHDHQLQELINELLLTLKQYEDQKKV